jgi:hypothetical protein
MSSAMDKILAAVQKTKSGGFKDPNEGKYWKAEADKSGNAFAIIRWLPGVTEDDPVFAQVYSHGFKNSSGRWYIEECPTTIKDKCPVCDDNALLWNSGNEKDKELVKGISGVNGSARKRKLSYISNILVVSDPTHPENEGKTFLFKYGPKIFDKVIGAMTPEFADEAPIEPFNLKTGCNFKLKMRRVDGQANFDKSEFDVVSKVSNFDFDTLHDLVGFTAPTAFKSYDELKTKLDTILGDNGRASTKNDDADFIAKKVSDSAKPKSEKKAPKVEESSDNDDDDSLDYFRKLAADDPSD